MTRENSDIETDVLVVGGGMAGLSVGVALAASGIETVVVDRDDAKAMATLAFDGRTTAIAAGSRDVLAATGAWPAIAPHAEPILDIRVTDGASPLFLHYDHRALGDAPLGYIVENRHIRAALAARLAALPAARLIDRNGVAMLDRQQSGVAAVLDDGTRIRARLAVAADGRRSPTRAAAGIAVTEWRYGQTAIVTTVRHERPHRGTAQERFLPAGPFAILPMTDEAQVDAAGAHRSSIVWTEADAAVKPLLALNDTAFAEELARRFGSYLGVLDPIGPRFSYPLALLRAERDTDLRLALVGEAAHCMHPIAGQGLNIGLRDVAALAECVVDGVRLGLDPGDATVLDRYQRWRRPDTLAMLAATDLLNRLFSNDLGPVRLARDLGLAAVERIAPLKRVFMGHAMGRVAGPMGALPRLMRGEAL